MKKCLYTCPCCGYLVLPGPPGSYDICPICFWEDDLLQLAFPDMAGGANNVSLIEAQQNFIKFGAGEERFKGNVRGPVPDDVRDSRWRPIDKDKDKYLKWNSPEDRALWRANNNRQLNLFYWTEEFWLKENNR